MAALITVITAFAALVTLAIFIRNLVRSVCRKIGKIKLWLVNLGRMQNLLEDLLAKVDQISKRMQEQDRAQVHAEEELDALEATKENLDDTQALWKVGEAKPDPFSSRPRRN